MERPRHWFIGSALGCLVAATLAVLTDAAMPPAAPRPAPLPLPPVAAGAVSPFADPALGAASPQALPPPTVAPPAPEPMPDLGPGTPELVALVDELANRPSVDAALDREMRDLLLADVRQRQALLRQQGGDAAEMAQLARLVERLNRLP